MVASTIDPDRNGQFVIQPNQSLTWREMKIFYGCIVAVSLSIATGFSVIGFWPILPFAGAELVLLGGCLYVCARRGSAREVVSVRDDSVEIEKGRDRPEQRWCFSRSWAQVRLLRPGQRRYPSRLVIRSHGSQVELGGFLNECERRQLAADLHRVICATPS
jgi:uncharacterized membrane protein